MPTYTEKNDLPHSLQAFCEPWSTGVRFMHPFLFEMLPFSLDLDINEVLCAAAEDFELQLQEKDWIAALNCVVGWRYRFEFINRDIAPRIPHTKMGHRQYWQLVISALRNSTNFYLQEREVAFALMQRRSNKPIFAESTDRNRFKDVPEVFTGWRGVNSIDDGDAVKAVTQGFSWTFSEEVAKKFSHRKMEFDGSPYIATSSFKRPDVVVFMPSLGEEEFIVIPDPNRSIKLLKSPF